MEQTFPDNGEFPESQLLLRAESSAARQVVEAFRDSGSEQRHFKMGNFVMATVLAARVTGMSHQEEIRMALESAEAPQALVDALASIPAEKNALRHYMSLAYFEFASPGDQKRYGLKVTRVTDKMTGRVMRRYALDDDKFIQQLASDDLD